MRNATTRLYAVQDKLTLDAKPRLISAANKQQALNFAARSRFVVSVANQSAVFDLARAGVEIEKAVDEPATESQAEG